MDERRWKEKWPHLDLLRDCTDSMDSCWLCDELQEWNAALKAFQIYIHEPLPGKISLATIPEGPPVHQDDPDETAFLWIWLLRKHRCIETLKLDGCSFRNNVAVPNLVVGFASNLRHISIEAQEFFDWSSVLDAIGPINNLQSFTLTGYGVTDDLLVRLVELLSANANSLRKVHVECRLCNQYGLGNVIRRSGVIMSGISSCKDLTSLAFRAKLDSPGSESLAMLLRSSRKMKEFWLDHSLAVEEAFCDFMRTNTTLTELHYSCRYGGRITDVLRAVESDNTLELLAIDCGPLEFGSRLVVAQGLRSLLSNNRRLRTLKIKRSEICSEFGGLLAEGLSENGTLECLDASECGVLFEAVQRLCHALTINKTCSVKLGFKVASPLERAVLARTLSEGKLYGRVQLTWTDFDAAGLRAALQQPTARSIDLVLSTEHLSCASFASLCQALSSSRLVYSLAVNLSSDTTPEHVDSLCDVLKKVQSLTRVTLIEDDDEDHGFAVRAAHVLRSNTSVTHLKIACKSLNGENAELLRSLMAESQSLNVVELEVEPYEVWRGTDEDEELDKLTIDILSQGMTENQFITSFHFWSGLTTIRDALTRNNVRLNRAARFVLGRNMGKVCAEAFELFEAQPSLVARVTEASGMSGRDAEAAVRSAKYFIRDNYFFITQVVRDKLECLPGEGTQIDQLNPACWRRILDYLKVADVIVP